MDDDATASHSDLQMEDVGHGGNDRSKGSYKSWKKKYRKMRDNFDRKMRDSEELYRREQKAIDTNKRIAVEIDRLLDMLLDLNNAPQIPTDKRFDLSLATRPKDMPDEPVLPIDRPRRADTDDDDAPRPGKSFAELLEKVPHHKYAAAARLFPDVVSDLEAGTEGFPGAIIDHSQTSHPASFLTADDIDNYLWEADCRIAQRRQDLDAPTLPQLPTLAPKALATLQEGSGNNGIVSNGATNGRKGERGGEGRSRGAAAAAVAADEAMSAASRDFALRNPTSVYNWLRKHAPKTFLQDGEMSADKENGDDDDHHAHNGGSHKGRLAAGDKAAPGSATRSRKSVGGAAERRAAAKGTTTPTANRRSSAGGARGTKRSAAAARSSLSASMIAASDLEDGASVATHDDDDETMSVDAAIAATPTAGKGAAGKRKRPADDDSGYRPKGGSSRPAKKPKRKSEGGGDGDVTPTATGRSSKARRSHLSTAEAADEPDTDEID